MISNELREQLNASPQKDNHEKFISRFLTELNRSTERYILKGGTALMECYGLDRFSEDIDLDSNDKSHILNFIDSFCKKNNILYRVAKDTDTVKRFMIHYDNEDQSRLLKVEISYRRGEINKQLFTKIDGINVYNINTLCMLKTNAYAQRDKIRDLFDITFIINNYYKQLSPEIIENTRNAVFQKGLEQFDYLVETQKDELINNDTLAENFLQMLDTLGVESEEVVSKNKIIEQMETARAEFFSRPKKARRDGIAWNGSCYGISEFEDLYLARCKKDGIEPRQEIKDHFWKNCVAQQGYTPRHCSREETAK